jgi:hypothetical protein
LDGYEGNAAVLGKDLRAWDRGYYRRIGVALEIPNHYLKLTAREHRQLFAGYMAAGQSTLMLCRSASDWNRTAASSSPSSRKACAAVWRSHARCSTDLSSCSWMNRLLDWIPSRLAGSVK